MIVPREQLVDRLNSITWLRHERITSEAESLIDDHLRKIRMVIKEVMTRNGVKAVEADGIAQTAGYKTAEYEALIDDLFDKVLFRGAGVRESLIANIAAGYSWDLDPELRDLPNPWLPLIELYGMGYTSSGEDDPDGNGLTLIVGFKGGLRSYRII